MIIGKSYATKFIFSMTDQLASFYKCMVRTYKLEIIAIKSDRKAII